MHVPEGSIYYWMFTQGIKAVPLERVLAACEAHGKHVREKDIANYYNGFYRSSYTGKRSILRFPDTYKQSDNKLFFSKSWEDYPIHPYLGYPDPMKRYIPVSKEGKPLTKWSETSLTFKQAKDYKDSAYVAENLKDTKHIVFDIDGDHDKELDIETIEFFWSMCCLSHRLDKPKLIKEYDGYKMDTVHGDMPASFHVTFRVDKVIPTMHFPKAHVDILGNEKNTMRMFKDKKWNGRDPVDMTTSLWEEIKRYIRYREEQ